MTAPMTYIVTTGEYSAYRIRGVYLDKAAAEARKELLDRGAAWPEASIEEWPSDGTPNTGIHYRFTASAGDDWRPRWDEVDGADYPEPELDRPPHNAWIEVCSNNFDRGLKALRDRIAEVKAHDAGLA